MASPSDNERESEAKARRASPGAPLDRLGARRTKGETDLALREKEMNLIAMAVYATLVTIPPGALGGRWEGAVQIPGRELPLVIDLSQDRGGHWIGSAIVPGLGIKGAPLGDVAVKDSGFTFVLKGALGEPTFKGRLAQDGRLTGDFQQAGNTAPFALKKTGPPQVEPPRESTPVRKELEGEWQGETEFLGNKVRAKLTLANRPGGSARADFQIVGQHEHNLTVDVIEQEGDFLTVESHEPGATNDIFTYEGRFQKGEIAGTLKDGPLESPMTLHPAAKKGPQS
jgi:hypothetical protein